MMIPDLEHIDTIAEKTSLTGGSGLDLSGFFAKVEARLDEIFAKRGVEEDAAYKIAVSAADDSATIATYSLADGSLVVSVSLTSSSAEYH